MAKNDGVCCRLVLFGVVISTLLGRMHGSLDTVVPVPLKSVLKNDDNSKKRSRSVAFKAISEGGVIETSFDKDKQLEAQEIIVPGDINSSTNSTPDQGLSSGHNYIKSTLHTPKSVAGYQVQPKDIEHYAQGWKKNPSLTHDVLQSKPFRKEFVREGLGKIMFNPQRNVWEWTDIKGNTFNVDPFWFFDRQVWDESQDLVFSQEGLYRLQDMLSLYVDGEWGGVKNIYPGYYQDPETQEIRWDVLRFVEDWYGNVWQIPGKYFNENTKDLTVDGQRIIEELHHQRNPLDPVAQNPYGKEDIWLLRPAD